MTVRLIILRLRRNITCVVC